MLFFAVLPAPAAAVRIAQWADEVRNQYGLRGRRRPAELLHVTLNAVGAYSGVSSDVLSAAIEVGSSVEAAPFEVTFDRVQGHGSPPARPALQPPHR